MPYLSVQKETLDLLFCFVLWAIKPRALCMEALPLRLRRWEKDILPTLSRRDQCYQLSRPQLPPGDLIPVSSHSCSAWPLPSYSHHWIMVWVATNIQTKATHPSWSFKQPHVPGGSRWSSDACHLSSFRSYIHFTSQQSSDLWLTLWFLLTTRCLSNPASLLHVQSCIHWCRHLPNALMAPAFNSAPWFPFRY